MIRIACVCSPIFLLQACSVDPPTEVVVVVDTDLSVPDHVSGIEIDVIMPSSRIETRSTALTSRAVLPVTLGVLYREGPLGPVQIEARAVHGGVVVVRRRASLALREHRSLLAWMVLSGACEGVDCPNETCDEGACRAIELRPEEIADYGGAVPMLDASFAHDGGPSDAGTYDAGACTGGGAEVCNRLDDDCDGRIDESFDLANDPENCGACARSCFGPSVVGATCGGGTCVVQCALGYEDCGPAPGCETALGTTTSCLSCTDSCSGTHPGGTRWECRAEGCAYDCDGNLANCDTSSSDCETDLNSDELHCGGCSRPCEAGERCTGGRCR
jgi:hypothetical protein